MSVGIAAVWAGPERCDIVLFQQTAGSFAPAPPAPGVGPGALADPMPFVAQLADAGIVTRIETVLVSFAFGTFSAAWDALAGSTAASLPPERHDAAQVAARAAMSWNDPSASRRFSNTAHLLIGARQA
jgi:hypothetical protein